MSTTSDQHQLPKYLPGEVEAKWQEKWEKDKVWRAEIKPDKKKFYVLDMFPYPSGRLHMGHVRNYTLGDCIARYRRAQGYNVLHPMGWDAFGLPAENAAIKNKSHPEKWTLENIVHMRKQFKRLGVGYDWDREIATCLPDYYRWEQLIFTQMFKQDLAYKKTSSVNWCPDCKTVLANEQVENGKCWRCENEVTTRELEQWFLKTTKYAQELLDELDNLKGWPDRVKSMQRNWIGRSEGAEIQFDLKESHGEYSSLTVFTTRPDTLFGVTYMAVAPEHPLATLLSKGKDGEAKVKKFIDKCRKTDKIVRTAEDAPKEGIFTGSYAVHPLTGDDIPIYVANFVLMDYGTGGLMAVPAHDVRDHAFARKYDLKITQVIEAPKDSDHKGIEVEAYTGAGTMTHSSKFDGMDSEKAKLAITQELESLDRGKKTVNFKLRDWGLSRQRYWGTPIPIVYCDKCGAVPVPEDQLPIKLPSDVEFTGEGGSPLTTHPDFIKTDCPKCGADNARRETDTMDTFMESSWYYLRYLSPKEENAPFNQKDVGYWLGIDQYIGGIEHATMHLMYFRFFHKVLRDMGYFPEGLDQQDLNEPCRNLLNQGMVIKDGAKMSKSKGNVVEPDEIINGYGADTARLFSMFAAPPEKDLDWAEKGVEGAYRFLNRVWRLVQTHSSLLKSVQPYAGKHADLSLEETRILRGKIHQTIAKATQDFEGGYHFNTVIAAIMELVNETYAFPVNMGKDESRQVLREAIETILRLLNPFAPHASEELWEHLGGEGFLIDQVFPAHDPDALVKNVITYVVQVNGKLRGNVDAGASLEKDQVLELAREVENVVKHLEGKSIVKTIFVPKKLINFVVK